MNLAASGWEEIKSLLDQAKKESPEKYAHLMVTLMKQCQAEWQQLSTVSTVCSTLQPNELAHYDEFRTKWQPFLRLMKTFHPAKLWTELEWKTFETLLPLKLAKNTQLFQDEMLLYRLRESTGNEKLRDYWIQDLEYRKHTPSTNM